MFLNDTWKLWFHDPYCESWDEKSYIELATVSTVEEIAEVYHAFKNIWSKGMFFLMREHIKPVWEDPHNASGGCFSYKVMKPEVPTQWLHLCARATGETLISPGKRPDHWEKICGISISPKRTYCILRIWVADAAWSDPQLYTVQLPAYTAMQFKTH
jgi:hypothetical protein